MTEQEFLEFMEVCADVDYGASTWRNAYQAGVTDTLRVLYTKLYCADTQVPPTLNYPSFWLRVADVQK